MQSRLAEPKLRYSFGPYNKVKDDKQAIRITEGCPWGHEYCYEPKEQKVFGIPEIVRNNVMIYDMNLLCKPEALGIIEELGLKRVNKRIVNYELVCGIDFRFLRSDIAKALFRSHFKNIRIAWDWFIDDQYKIKDAIGMLRNAGYKNKDIMIFMICNWKIPMKECIRKLDLCKVWNVQAADCYFDKQVFPNVQPVHWTYPECKEFRHMVRKHNQIVNFGIDPEVKFRSTAARKEGK